MRGFLAIKCKEIMFSFSELLTNRDTRGTPFWEWMAFSLFDGPSVFLAIQKLMTFTARIWQIS
jgi:hypothetical protein